MFYRNLVRWCVIALTLLLPACATVRPPASDGEGLSASASDGGASAHAAPLQDTQPLGGGLSNAFAKLAPQLIPPIPPGQSAFDQPAIPGVSAEAYLVVDAETNRVLIEQNSAQRRPIASLTKVMTALLVLESMRLNDQVSITEAVLDLEENSTIMGLVPGDRVSVQDLLYGLLLPSGNDAAIALALQVGGSNASFVARMNSRAQELGLRDTNFANPHGLHSRAGGYSTARDMVRLGQVAMQSPAFRTIVNTPEWEARGEKKSYPLRNGNLLLINYEGADGVKIGFTEQAKQTLIGSVVQQGRRLFVVVLGSSHRVIDSMRLLDLAFPKVLAHPQLSEFATGKR